MVWFKSVISGMVLCQATSLPPNCGIFQKTHGKITSGQNAGLCPHQLRYMEMPVIHSSLPVTPHLAPLLWAARPALQRISSAALRLALGWMQ